MDATNLTKQTIQLLNEQIVLEHKASLSYLDMATWAAVSGYEGAASFLYKQSAEEQSHMLRLIHYLTERNQRPLLPNVQQESVGYASLEAVFQQVLTEEITVTQSIIKLVAHVFAEKDLISYSFLQWFVAEQREEEATARKILDLFKVIEPTGIGLFTIDKQIGTLHDGTETT